MLDFVSIDHRLAGLLASIFDIVFAIDRVPHPGEKRLLEAAIQRCPSFPDGFAHQVTAILQTATTDRAELGPRIDRHVDGLDEALRRARLWPPDQTP